ncbi:class I SAM-dependent methyltransferase [Ornithinimicrobium faecis]|uniref:Methyltransferase n=1 Tax=Ornithinimicrobium faecis TaxID=2934158 RepID=A0ABY4YRA5_9MICO|nr:MULTISPECIES: methyltransferase [unclassified Ornithinimicrobium]USQ78687.1 methyltransferase [Ornithinimicrobium sp. HY1793]
MSQDHYFTAEPASPAELREREVELAGHTVTVQTAGGIFSPDGIDKGTSVLLKHAPRPPEQGTFLDLGCGWGPMALTMALHSPAATVHAVDVNQRALDLVRRNAAALGCAVTAVTPDEAPGDTAYDLIWSNPPIRVGKAVLHEMMRAWLPRLASSGEAWLVVQKNLGADSLLKWLANEFPDLAVDRPTTSGGFRLIRVARP